MAAPNQPADKLINKSDNVLTNFGSILGSISCYTQNMLNENFVILGFIIQMLGSLKYIIGTIQGKVKPNSLLDNFSTYPIQIRKN